MSIHADYRCRHSGECCTADWDVPVELHVYRSLADAVGTGRLRPAPRSADLQPFILEPELSDEAAAMLERNERGECVFFEGGSRLCVVHRDLGHDALPATCRHFPRVAIRDGRGASIGLSHFCPTAAAMLFRDDVELSVVDAPPAFPPADYEGLVVTADELAPLLSPGVVMDLATYNAWKSTWCGAPPQVQAPNRWLPRWREMRPSRAAGLLVGPRCWTSSEPCRKTWFRRPPPRI